MKLLLFDVDATLILTGGAGLRALNRVFRDLFDVDSAMNDVKPHGKTDPAIVREIFQTKLVDRIPDDAIITRVLAAYVECLREEVETTNQYVVLPGIREILDDMHQRPDVVMGLATGNIETGARIKLQRGDLNRYFEFGGYGSDAEDRVGLVRSAAKKARARSAVSIDDADVFVIGDTPRDIDAGRGAGFNTVGVATGPYSVEELTSAGADFAIKDFREGRDHFLRSTRMV